MNIDIRTIFSVQKAIRVSGKNGYLATSILARWLWSWRYSSNIGRNRQGATRGIGGRHAHPGHNSIELEPIHTNLSNGWYLGGDPTSNWQEKGEDRISISDLCCCYSFLYNQFSHVRLLYKHVLLLGGSRNTIALNWTYYISLSWLRLSRLCYRCKDEFKI